MSGVACAPETGLTDVLVGMVAKAIRCPVMAVFTVVDGPPAVRAGSTRRVFVAALDRVLGDAVA